MSERKADFSRRNFLSTVGAVGLASMLSPIESLAYAQKLTAANDPQLKAVPTRPFGKTGVRVPILGIGGAFNLWNQLLLKQAVKMGVTYWDTAEKYGKSEKAIGKYFIKYPEDRKKIFLVTKSTQTAPHLLTRSLETSLERMKTSYIDLYFCHGIQDIIWLDDEIKTWAQKAKAKGKIRFFGFSTHKNMEKCLLDASKLGWVDGIMASYNYRLMHTDSMKRAVDACVQAGIGLTAMKTQAKKSRGYFGDVGEENETAEKLTERFMERGYTVEQAKLKAVWENTNISSICSHMTNMTVLQANVAAALSKTKLSSQNKQLLDRYARETGSHYCAGCAHNCEPAINNEVPISDVMRYLMYHRSYGESESAKALFKELPSEVRKYISNIDYTTAEKKCPQKMQIGRLMREATIELV